MYVAEIKNVSWLKHPFFRNKHLIKNEDEVQALKDCGGCEIYIDTDIGDDLDPNQDKPDEAGNTLGTKRYADESPPSEQPQPDTLDQEKTPSTEYVDWHWDFERAEEVVQFFDVEQSLSHMEGNEEFLRETVQIFLEEYPQILARLRVALDDADARTLKMEAHSMKGAMVDLGATSAYDAAFRLEHIGRAESWGRAYRLRASTQTSRKNPLRLPVAKGKIARPAVNRIFSAPRFHLFPSRRCGGQTALDARDLVRALTAAGDHKHPTGRGKS